MVPVAVALAYLAAARRVPRRWPIARTAAFAGGAAAAAVALTLEGEESFTVHVLQHLLLGMLAPALLVLGAPVTLALQVCPPRARRAIGGVLDSRAVALLTSPVVVWLLFGVVSLAMYLTPLYRMSLEDESLHLLLHAVALGAGGLFFWAVIGVDRVGRGVPHGARLLMVLFAVPFHAVLGVALLASAEPLAAAHSLSDHRTGAGVLWAAGDGLGVAVALVVLAQWMRHEDREAAREDRVARRSAGGSGGS